MNGCQIAKTLSKRLRRCFIYKILLNLSIKYNPNLARILFVFLLVFHTLLLAQRKAGGTVQDSNGEAVPYATIYFKDSYKGTLSDENRKFYMEIDNYFSVRVVSLMRYKILV